MDDRFCRVYHRAVFTSVHGGNTRRRDAVRENECMLPPHKGYETSVESGKEDERLIWTKEVPTKLGKYITRYMNETTGRMRYGTYTVHQYGIRRVHLTRPVETAVFDSWKLEFSKRVEDEEK